MLCFLSPSRLNSLNASAASAETFLKGSDSSFLGFGRRIGKSFSNCSRSTSGMLATTFAKTASRAANLELSTPFCSRSRCSLCCCSVSWPAGLGSSLLKGRPQWHTCFRALSVHTHLPHEQPRYGRLSPPLYHMMRTQKPTTGSEGRFRCRGG